MKKKEIVLFVSLFALGIDGYAQNYRDSLKVAGVAAYQQQVKQHANKQLVEISRYIPNIRLDIRYATTNNFMQQRMYKQARAFARLPVVIALKAVQADLNAEGLGLKIFDAYRPYTITEKFYQKASNKSFVADPKKGSKHNRGCAIDLTVIKLLNGQELDMPTPYDSFSEKAAANYANLAPNIIANREMLKILMARHGFKVIANEWWHYDFNGWANYELLDIPFELL